MKKIIIGIIIAVILLYVIISAVKEQWNPLKWFAPAAAAPPAPAPDEKITFKWDATEGKCFGYEEGAEFGGKYWADTEECKSRGLV